jgi:hypothetical protein
MSRPRRLKRKTPQCRFPGAVWGAATAGQLALIPLVDDPGSDIDNWVGAPLTALSAASALLFPGAVLDDEPRVAEAEAQLQADPCGGLARAEAALAHSAADQANARAWHAHAINFGLNAAYTLILGLGFKRWESGLIGGAIGLAAGEVMVLTQPWGLTDAWRTYQDGQLTPQPPRLTISLAPAYTSHGLTLNVLGRF